MTLGGYVCLPNGENREDPPEKKDRPQPLIEIVVTVIRRKKKVVNVVSGECESRCVEL